MGSSSPGGRVHISFGGLMPLRQLVTGESHGVGGGPPDLMVGGGDDLPEDARCAELVIT